MKRIAVSQRVDHFPDRGEVRDAMDWRLVTFIAATGSIAIPVPNALQDLGSLDSWLAEVKPDAVILSGGNDIGLCQERDLTESALLDYANEWRLPVLGICRGMQMMGHWAGVELVPVQGHVRSRHKVIGEITGERNSFHNFVLQDCPSGYSVLARSEDGRIEAFRRDGWRWEGWMWHPERELEFDQRDIYRFKELIA